MADLKMKRFISDNNKLKQKRDNFPKIYDNIDIESLSLILDSQPSLINTQDEKTGWTLLFRAVLNGNYQMAEFLLEKRDADPNVSNVYAETPLHHAVENANHKLINLLLEKGADPNAQQQDGETAMHIAAVKGDYKVIKLLHLYGGDPEIRTYDNGYSSLDYATERGNERCIEVIQNLMLKKTIKAYCNYNDQHYQEDRVGLQTTKNSDSPINRLKSNMNFESDHFSGINNNTSKNLRNPNTYVVNNSNNDNYIYFSNDVKNSKTFLLNSNKTNNKCNEDRRDRNKSCNLNSQFCKNFNNEDNYNLNNYNNNNEYDDVYDQESYRKAKRNIPVDNSSQSYIKETSFINQMNNFEERLEKIKKDLIEDVILNSDGNIINTNKKLMQEYNSNIQHSSRNEIQSNEHNNSIITTGTRKNGTANKINYSKKHGYSSASLPSYLNYANLINSHNSRKQSIRENSLIQLEKEKDIISSSATNYQNKDHDFTLYNEENRMITLQPDESIETPKYNENDNDNENEEVESNRTRIIYPNKTNTIDDVYNLPLRRDMLLHNTNNSLTFFIPKTLENSEGNISKSRTKIIFHAVEQFEDYNKVLAVFLSSKNDLDENCTKNFQGSLMFNENGFSTTLRNCFNGNLKEDGESTMAKKYAQLFNFNFNEMNEFIMNTENKMTDDNEEDEEEEDEGEDEEDLENFLSGHIENKQTYNYNNNFDFSDNCDKNKQRSFTTSNNKGLPYNTVSNCNPGQIKYFSKSKNGKAIKEEYKPIALDTQNINEVSVSNYNKSPLTDKNIVSKDTLDRININFEQIKKDGSGLIELEYNSTEAIREINLFLKALDLDRYTYLFIKNGFDDLRLVIDQMKSNMAITDKNLRDIGIKMPGHRAKILLKLEEECNNFEFSLPSNVYHSISENVNIRNLDINSDPCINSLHQWLLNLKLEQFVSNFIQSGYHSIELLFVQMISKNPLNEKILNEDIGINKIGYRIRILNKLLDDSRLFYKKLKSKLNLSDRKDIITHESCRCGIF